MAKAGYCEDCEANVWLTEDGACSNGHPAESVSGAYESEPLAVPQQTLTPSPDPRRRRRTALVVAGVLVTALVLCIAVVALLVPVLSRAGTLTDEWRSRLAEDYPDWQVVGFNVRSYSGKDSSETEYSFAMIPPDRDFAVGVIYVSEDGGTAACQDEIFRPAGTYHDRAESLLDYIEQNYVDAGKSVTEVTTSTDGAATVSWMKESRVGPVSSRVGSFDELEFDEAGDTWSVSFSPGD